MSKFKFTITFFLHFSEGYYSDRGHSVSGHGKLWTARENQNNSVLE